MYDQPLAALHATLATILSLLRDSNQRAVVIGGVAAATLGQPRFTHDVDLCATLTNQDLRAFYQAAAERGLQARMADFVEFSKRSRMILLHDVGTDTDIDISMAALPFELEAIERALALDVGGLVVPIVSPEDLIIMKAVAKRPQDRADIQAVLDSHPGLDLARVRFYLPQFADALDDPEIVEGFERQVREWHERREQDARHPWPPLAP